MLSLTFSLILFTLFATTTLILYSHNTQTRVFTLITTFVLLFLTLLLLGDQFIAIATLIIYVGAIAILFILSVMLFSEEAIHAGHKPITPPALLGPLALLVAVSFFDAPLAYLSLASHNTNYYLQLTIPNYELMLYTIHDVYGFCKLLYIDYSDMFLMSGILLVLAIIGVIVMTIPTKKN